MSDDEALDVWAENMKLEGEILRLRAENEKLRAALKPFADKYAYIMPKHDLVDACRAAADALKEMGE